MIGQKVLTFEKGISSDLSTTSVPESTYLMLENGELLTFENGIFLIQSVRGTKHSFSIPESYIPIAMTVIENMLFILSYDKLTTKIAIGYTKLDEYFLYVPLNNYKITYDASKTAFLTDKMGYSVNSKVNMIAKKIYDSSINLYLSDGINPDYCINTGMRFDNSGLYNSIVYTDLSFTSKARLFMTCNTLPIEDTTGSKVDVGGMLKPGVYFLFIRYMDEIRNKTKFVSYLKPFQIHPNVGSARASIFLSDDDSTITNKKITVALKDIDREYPYIEIGYVRKYSTTKGEATETKIISRAYETGYQSTMTIVIDGTESLTDTTFEELYEQVKPIYASNAHSVLNGRLFAVGLKAKWYDRVVLKEFFKRVTLDFIKYQETNINVTERNRSIYWPEQIYQFVAFAVFDDMSTSEPFPIAGFDGTAYGDHNGYCKIPSGTNFARSIALQISLNSTYRIDEKNAKEYYNANSASSETLRRIKYISVMRSERVRNILYSGLSIPTTFRFNQYVLWDGDYSTQATVNGVTVLKDSVSKIVTTGVSGVLDRYLGRAHTSQSYNSALHFPFFRGIAPGYFAPKTFSLVNYAAITSLNAGEKMRIALFSPDAMFCKINKLSNGQKVYITRKLTTQNQFEQADINTYNPGVYAAKYVYLNDIADDYKQATAYVVDEDTVIGPANFSSTIRDYFAVGKKSEELALNAELDLLNWDANWLSVLRSNRTKKYIGIIYDTLTWAATDYTSAYIEDVYLSINDATFFSNAKLGAKEFKSFRLIGSPYKLSDLLLANSETIYQGDCYFLPTLFLLNKSHEFGGSDVQGEPDEWIGDDGYGKVGSDGINNCYGTSKKNYHFGIFAYMYCYSEVHPGARCVTKDRTYYEAENNETIYESGVFTSAFKAKALPYTLSNTKKYTHESNEVYMAYSDATLIYKAMSLEDYTDDSNKYISGVAFSARQVVGEIQDSFRIFDMSKIKIFATELGGITGMVGMNERFLLIHNYGVTIHSSEMQFKQKVEGSTISIGSGEILPDVYSVIGNYGAMYQHEIVEGLNGIYGFDTHKDAIWVIDKSNMQQHNLPYVAGAFNFISRYKTDYGKSMIYNSSISSRVVIYADKDKGQILFSIPGYGGMTFIYNELLKTFTSAFNGCFTNIVRFGTNLYTTHYFNTADDCKIFLLFSSSNSDKLNIFGSNLTFKFAFRLNGGSEDGLTLLPKYFNALMIASQNLPFDRIKFTSEFMKGEYTPFYSLSREDFWNNPVWKENMWCVPVLVKTDAKVGYAPINVGTEQDKIYGIDPGTQIRGLYMDVQLEYDRKVIEDNDIYIKHVIATFNKSVL